MTQVPPSQEPTPQLPGAGSPTVIVWVMEGTWQACVDAARALAPAHPAVRLLASAPEALRGTAQGASAGLRGRGHPARDPGPRPAEIAPAPARELLDAAAHRLGRPCSQIERRGRAEREVVAAAADAYLLILARDGDRSRLGPKSLGPASRFVVDHAPCQILLVWPADAPGTQTMPPPPPGPPRPPRHRPGRT